MKITDFLKGKDCKKSIKVVSYLFVLDLVPFLLKKGNSDFSFHAKQGFVQMVLWIILPFVLIIPLVGWVLGTLLLIANLIIMINGIYSVITNKEHYVPFIGKSFERILS